MKYRFFIAALLLFLALALELIAGEQSGLWINFALAALIAAAFFVSFAELLILILFSVFILNSQPGFSFEFLVFSLLPVAAFIARKFIPVKPWLGSIAACASGVLLPYLIFAPRLFLVRPGIILVDLLGALAFCAIAFQGLESSG